MTTQVFLSTPDANRILKPLFEWLVICGAKAPAGLRSILNAVYEIGTATNQNLMSDVAEKDMQKTLNKFVRRWGTTKKHSLASWILPDGRMVGGICFPTHERMINAVFKGRYIFSEFLSETGIIRCSEDYGLLNLTVSKEITPDQQHQILLWPLENMLVDCVVMSEEGEHYRSLGEYKIERIEDVCDKIRIINLTSIPIDS